MAKINASPIQKHLEIKEIKEDMIILKNGGVRAVLMTSSVNFVLKSKEEQEALVFRYQEFLNSLDFPIQIVIASRKFRIDDYLQFLEEQIPQQKSELLQIQTNDYIEFVKGLTEITNIMTESFYVVVPYTPIRLKKLTLWEKLGFKKKKTKTETERELKQLKNQLWQRVNFVVNGLAQIGLRAVPLNTQELIELFYKFYNPSAKEEPEIEKAKKLRLE